MMFLTIMILTILAVFMIHRYASNRVRRSIAWGCGFTDPAPLGQYSADSFSQPLRRVFAGHLFRTRDRVDMPAPGGRARPFSWNSRSRLGLAVRPSPALSAGSPTGSMPCQFLTIRSYLSLMFFALVVLLVMVAVSQ